MDWIRKHKQWLIIAVVVLVAVGSVGAYFVKTNLTAAEQGSVFGTSSLAEEEPRTLETSADAPAGMLLAASDEGLELFIHADTADIAVRDKTNGTLWRATPPDAGQDEKAVGDWKNRLQSQVFLEYYNEKYELKTMDSYFYAVKEEQFAIVPIRGGVRVEYTIGKTQYERAMLPQVLEIDTFEKDILEAVMDEEARDMLTRRYVKTRLDDLDEFYKEEYLAIYPALPTDQEYYILDLYAPSYEFEELYKIVFETTPYTLEDLARDNAAHGIDGIATEPENFFIPVEYTLRDGGFSACIPMSAVRVPESMKLSSIYLLEFFGAGGVDDNGYLVLPDGSGSLINFNNGKSDTTPYLVQVYGDDAAIRKESAGDILPSASIPVFALSKTDCGFVAVIDEGDAHAGIQAQVSGVYSSYNTVCSRFNVLPVDYMRVSSAQDAIVTNKYQEKPYQGNIRVTYRFTGKNNSTYADFAVLYREQLIQQGKLQPVTSGTIPFLVELVGSVKVEKDFLGVPYTDHQVLTSFDQAREILDDLTQAGVTDVDIKYSSWVNGSSRYNADSSSGIAAGMGGQEALSSLSSALGGGHLYLNTGIVNMQRGLLGFNNIFYGVRLTYNEVVGIRPFNIATGLPDPEQKKQYLLSSRYLEDHTVATAAALLKQNTGSIWFEDLGSDLNSDFREGATIDRQEALRMTQQTVQAVLDNSGEALRLGFDRPNQYVFQYMSQAANVPLTSSAHRLQDEAIPFLPIVLSGCVEYAGTPVNLSGQSVDDMLKAVETGSGLYFRWIYQDNDFLRTLEGEEVSGLYSLDYKEWIDQAAAFYRRMQSELQSVYAQPVTGHEKLQDKVYVTHYGTASVYVNYNDDEVVLQNGVKVAAKDYTVVKEGAA